MACFLDRFCKSDFVSYEDFYENFALEYPKDFNYAYDVLDALAAEQPEKTALVWCNDTGEERSISFAEMKRESDKYANALRSLGLRAGDAVMVMLKRRYEFWFFSMAAHKLGAVLIPATHLLTVKDLVYRTEKASIKMILTVNDEALCRAVKEAQQKTEGILQVTAVLSGEREGFLDFSALAERAGGTWTREYFDVTSPMLAYFTSGTTGMPKIVSHDYLYPLGHIITAKFWHGLGKEDLHLTVADTGWAKAAWGKLYGQWLCEAAIFVYDYSSRFHPTDFLALIDKYGVTSFCAPPTIYRFLIKEDLSRYSLASLQKCTIAGEPLNPEVYQQWLQATGLKLREGYGQTEGPVMVAVTVWDEPKPGSMGKPLPNTRCDVYDGRGALCEVGEEGELCIPV
ncbi:MAG: AMP-binding protein, partial [Oscillospiraceae bacterium]|nr:AMP-binding protein [Oscillospiraceae bacterium]